jgi:putative ABC transport system permease protein
MDFRIAARSLRRTPAFSLLVIATLALGIGATATMFSTVWAVYLRPLPFPQPDRLVTIWESDARSNETQRRLTPANFVDWEAAATSFGAFGVLPNWTGQPWPFNVAGRDGLERVAGIYASSGFFRVMGVAPLLGRVFTSDEDRTRGRRSVVISHAMWLTRFGGDPSVIDRSLEVDTFRGGAFTIVGVMPQGFEFPHGADLWLSLADWGGGAMPPPGDVNRCCAWYATFGRLKRGVTREQAAAELTTLARRTSAAYPGSAAVSDVRVLPLRETLVGAHRTTVFGLFGAVACILLIACANVANLLLTRAVGRRREIATRLALGATRWQVARQLLLESLILGTLGAALGIALSFWAQEVIAAAFAGRVPLIENTRLDRAVLAFSIVLSLATRTICGLAPLADWRAAGWAARGQTETPQTRRLRQGLVVSEIALAVAIVASAGLLVRTVAKLRAVDVGFDTTRTLVVSTDLSTSPLRERGASARFVNEVLPRIERLPGVRSVAAATGVPFEGGPASQPITRQHDPVRPAASSPQIVHTAVTPGYFATMGMTLTRGRGFTERDGAEDVLVAIVNETAARRYWPGEDPIGKRFAVGSLERFGSFRRVRDGEVEWREIVGMVSDIRSAGFALPVQAEVYYSHQQFPLYNSFLLIRSTSDPVSLIPAVRRELAAVNSRAVISAVRTLEDVADRSIGDQVLRASMAALFSALAMLLGMCGVYGVMSYTVEQRTREIGIRVALGAGRAEVARLVVGQALALTAAGVVIGLAAAYAIGRSIASLFFGVSAADAQVLALTCLVSVAAALLATLWPARRALRVEPTVALREE